MAQKTYIPSVHNAAQDMCKLLARATPVIVRIYGGNAALLAALSAANAACDVLVQEAGNVRSYEDTEA